MGMKHFNPTTPSLRNMTVSTFDEITKKTPEKSLLATKKKNAGRNSYGRITVRHQGGGNRQKYRIVDFKRKKDDMTATVIGIEYDPNRSANIALIEYEDGERAYILAPIGLTDGNKVVSGEKADIKPGNCMKIENIPVGTMIHNIELNPGQGGKLVRAAGQEAQLMAKEGKYAHVRLPSGEMRLVMARCRATIGTIGNSDHENVKVGKAGNSALGKVGQAVSNFGSKMGGKDYTSGGIGSNLKMMGDYLQASSMSKSGNAGNQRSSRLSRFGSGMMNAGKESMAQAMSNVMPSRSMYRRRYRGRDD